MPGNKQINKLLEIVNKLQNFAIEHDLNMSGCEDIAEVFIKYVENRERVK